jgi:hypothetical protein
VTATATTLAAALPAKQPDDPGARLLLFGVRQMGANGLEDATAAQAFVTGFGKAFRRPLMLLRTLMRDMSETAAGPIQIAPWCCPRITGSERTLLAVLGRVRTRPEASALLLSDLLGVGQAFGVLATAHALAESFADLGLPLDD